MKKFAFAIAAVALAASAQAATITQTFSDTNNALQTTDFDGQALNLSLFDNTLGTLTGVRLRVGGENTTTLSFTNNSGLDSRVTRSSVYTDLYFGSSLGSLDALFAAAQGATVPLAARPAGGTPLISLSTIVPNTTVAVGATVTPLNNVGASEPLTAFDVSSILSAFSVAGGGALNLTCSSDSGLTSTVTGGNLDVVQDTRAACQADVEYTYTAAPPPAVPEPGSMALVGLALAGLGLTARRRAK